MKNRSLWILAAGACAAAFAIGRVSAGDPPAAAPAAPDWVKKIEGKWDASIDMQGMVSKGETTFSSVLNGMFVRQEFKAEMMGSAFEGVGYDSCDPSGKVTSAWMDSMTPRVTYSEGTRKEDGSTVLTGKMEGPDGAAHDVTYTTKWVDDNSFVFEISAGGPDGKPMTMLKITYTRKK
jgi:hypothetical protein